jgi:glycosyltransferase involved in cell wall biosynthesis
VDLNSADALVSIIIPTYDQSAYLREAIESAVQQTYRNLEILVSDDCSPNSPQDMIKAFQAARIRFWRNPKNLGMFENTLNGFRRATGKYVVNLNDDNSLNPDFLDKLVPHLEANPALVLAFSDHYIINADSNIDVISSEAHSREWRCDGLAEGIYQPFYDLALQHQAVSPTVAAVIRRDVIDWERFPDGAGVFWDLYTAYLACRSGGEAYYSPEKLAPYRVREQSETFVSGSRDAQAKIRKAQAGAFCYRSFMEDPRMVKLRPYSEEKRAHANTTLGIGLLCADQSTEARSHLYQALQSQKFNLRIVFSLILSYISRSLTTRLL